MPDVVRLVLRVAFMNIPTKVGWRAWRANFRALDERGHVVCINEAGSSLAKRVYAVLAQRRRLGRYGLFIGPNPIFWDRSRYRLFSATQVKLHGHAPGRRFRLWPGYNSARYATVVVLEPLAGGPLETYINGHWVPPGRKVDDAWRERMREISERKTAEIIEQHRAAGRIVALMGDLNLRHEPDLGEHVTWLRGDGVDKLAIALPDGVELTGGPDVARGRVDVFPGITDHKHGVSADIHLEIGAAA